MLQSAWRGSKPTKQWHGDTVGSARQGTQRECDAEVTAGQAIAQRTSSQSDVNGRRTGVATSGVLSNLVVYLIKEYHVPSVDAAQISNIVAGCLSLAPVAGAVVADAFFGCYPIVAISMAFSVLVSDYSVVLITVVCFLDRLHNTTGSSTCC